MSAITYRAATLEDAELASDVMTAAYPPMAQDPAVTRYRWQNTPRGHSAGRFFADVEGQPAAFLGWYHAPWERLPERHCELDVWLDRTYLDLQRLVELWSWLGEQAIEEGAWLLVGYCCEDEPEMLEALDTLGYQRERLEKAWELDLKRHGPQLTQEAAAARDKTAEAGIRLLTVADWNDPDKIRKLFELNERTVQDIPHSVPIVPDQFEDFVNRLQAPDRRLDRLWVAVDGDRVAAMSFLKFPPLRGPIWTGYTCSHPDYRGRGIARAVKLQTLAQAVEVGLPTVVTANDSENAPMLHINETLGYTRRPGFVEHHKRVEIP